MPLDAPTIRRLAHLARLHIDETEVPRLQSELSGILGWIEQLNEVDVTGIPPLVGAADMTLRLRPDVVTTDLTGGNRAEAVLANAPDRVGPFYAVPKVVE